MKLSEQKEKKEIIENLAYSYKQCLKRNSISLLFHQTLINNYKNDNYTMYCNLNQYKVNIEYFKRIKENSSLSSIQQVKHYFAQYSILISDCHCDYQEIPSNNKNQINSISLQKDGCLLVVFSNNMNVIIEILNPLKHYHCDFSYTFQYDQFYSLEQIDDNEYISTYYLSFAFWTLDNKKFILNQSYTVSNTSGYAVLLDNKRVAYHNKSKVFINDCVNDSGMNLPQPSYIEKINKFAFNKLTIEKMLYIKENKLLIVIWQNKEELFAFVYNINTFQCISTIKYKSCYIKHLGQNFLLFDDYKTSFLFNCNTYSFEREINYRALDMMLSRNNRMLCCIEKLNFAILIW